MVRVANHGPLLMCKGPKRGPVGVTVLAIGPDVTVVDEAAAAQEFRVMSNIMSPLGDLQ